MSNNFKKWLFIFFIAFSIRLIAAIFYLNFDPHALANEDGRQPFLPFGKSSNNIWEVVGDRDGYNTLAYNMLVYGKLGQVPNRNPSFPPPLYPVFLTICYCIFGFNIFGFFIPHIILDSVNSMLILSLGQQVFSNKVGIIASLLYALSPHFILLSIQLYSETLYFFLVLSLFLFCLKLFSKAYKKYSIYTGLAMALAALCRSAFLSFIPFMFIWLIAAFYHERRKMLILLFGVFLSFSLVYGIWVARNIKAFPRILFFEASRVAWWGTNSISDTNESLKHRNKYKDDWSAFLNWVKDNPRQYFNRCITRLRIFLFASYPAGVSNRNKIISSIIFFTIYPLAILGITKAVKDKNKIAFLALLFIVSKIILHVLLGIEGELRYRLPVEIFVIIFAASGLISISKNYRTTCP